MAGRDGRSMRRRGSGRTERGTTDVGRRGSRRDEGSPVRSASPVLKVLETKTVSRGRGGRSNSRLGGGLSTRRSRSTLRTPINPIVERISFADSSMIPAIKKHSYKSDSSTPLDNLLNIFWEFSSGFVPTSISPNVITIVGLLSVLIATAMMLQRSDDMKAPLSFGFRIFCAVALFIQQTLDAIDGKHARRTKTSSPLGQLLDHGCDVISVNLVIVLAVSSLQVGWGSIFAIVLALAQANQLMAALNEAYFGCFKHHISFIGVTEGQCFVMFAQLLPVIVSPHMLDTSISTVIPLPILTRFTFRESILLLSAVAMTFTSICAAVGGMVHMYNKTRGAIHFLQVLVFGCVQAAIIRSSFFGENLPRGLILITVGYGLFAVDLMVRTVGKQALDRIRLIPIVCIIHMIVGMLLTAPRAMLPRAMGIFLFKQGSSEPRFIFGRSVVDYWTAILAILFIIRVSATLYHLARTLRVPLFVMP